MRRLRQWAPAIVWALVITGFSTRYFTMDETARFLLPVLHWLLPHASSEMLTDAQSFIRKLAHFSEYFVFSLLVLHGFRSGRREWKWRWALTALALTGCYSALDELHQALVPGRGASPRDSLLDTLAGASALFVAWLYARWQMRRLDRTAAHRLP